MSKGNIDSPQGSKLLGQEGFGHKAQTKGHKTGEGMGAGRGVGGAEHHKGASFGGSAHSFRGGQKSPTSGKYGGQVIK